MASAHDPAADTGASAGAGVAQPAAEERPREGSLARSFRRIVESLPDDWTDLELDLRIADESRYVEAAVFMVTCNAQPYSHHDWHWRLRVAHSFGHAASAPTVHGTLALLETLAGEGRLAGLGGTLGFFAHVDTEVRERAEEAGFDLVVPRSRIAREAPTLVERLSSTS